LGGVRVEAPSGGWPLIPGPLKVVPTHTDRKLGHRKRFTCAKKTRLVLAFQTFSSEQLHPRHDGGSSQ